MDVIERSSRTTILEFPFGDSHAGRPRGFEPKFYAPQNDFEIHSNKIFVQRQTEPGTGDFRVVPGLRSTSESHGCHKSPVSNSRVGGKCRHLSLTLPESNSCNLLKIMMITKELQSLVRDDQPVRIFSRRPIRTKEGRHPSLPSSFVSGEIRTSDRLWHHMCDFRRSGNRTSRRRPSPSRL
jgi:hypothetical protein